MVDQVISHYKVLDKLGAGGMGEVYRAQDTLLNRVVALKVLSNSNSGDLGRRRFIQEAQAASALNHPNIVTIHDIVSHEDSEYMVMEFVSGKTLAELIPAGGLGVAKTLELGVQIADALDAAHQAGIVHRDLKPGNVMVTDSGLVKILDFGLAKLADRQVPEEGDNTSTIGDPLTMTGSILGTVSYMSPEQAQGKRVDLRSDLFSFGVVLYEMVTGRRAFTGDSAITTLAAILRDDVKPIGDLVSGVPGELSDVIGRALRKDPEERWQSAKEMRSALLALKQRSDSGLLARPPVAPPRKSRLPLVAGVAVVLAAAAAGAWWVTRPPSIPNPVPVAARTAAPKPVVGGEKKPSPVTALLPRPDSPTDQGIGGPQGVPGSVPATRSVALSDGEELNITLTEDIPAAVEPGRQLHFAVESDLQVGERIVIAKGAPVTGEIVEAARKRFLRGAKPTFRLIRVQSADGAWLKVRATPQARGGNSARTLDSHARPSSKDIAVDSGAEFSAYIDGDQTVILRH